MCEAFVIRSKNVTRSSQVSMYSLSVLRVIFNSLRRYQNSLLQSTFIECNLFFGLSCRPIDVVYDKIAVTGSFCTIYREDYASSQGLRS